MFRKNDWSGVQGSNLSIIESNTYLHLEDAPGKYFCRLSRSELILKKIKDGRSITVRINKLNTLQNIEEKYKTQNIQMKN